MCLLSTGKMIIIYDKTVIIRKLVVNFGASCFFFKLFLVNHILQEKKKKELLFLFFWCNCTVVQSIKNCYLFSFFFCYTFYSKPGELLPYLLTKKKKKKRK